MICQKGVMILLKFGEESSKVIAQVIHKFNTTRNNEINHYGLLQAYNLEQGFCHYGERGKEAAFDKMRQLHARDVFVPVKWESLTDKERDRSMESLTFLVEKNGKQIKAQTCANGSVQRKFMSKEDASSPTVATESNILTGIIDAREKRDLLTLDIPKAFVQTPAGTTKDGERIIMKIRGASVDILIALDPLIYRDYVSIVNGKKILHVQVLKTIYGMLQSALLFYKKLRNDLESIGFKINPYDPCVANRLINGTQHTVVWHVDDLKSSHKSAQVNDNFHNWLNEKYGNESIGIVKAIPGKLHKYLGMTLDYSENEVLQIDVQEYLEEMIKEFPYDLGDKKVKYPWDQNLFKVWKDEKNTQLKDKDHEIFHTFVAKGLFLAKRARSDIMPCIAF
jgi:hypothetical protein